MNSFSSFVENATDSICISLLFSSLYRCSLRHDRPFTVSMANAGKFSFVNSILLFPTSHCAQFSTLCLSLLPFKAQTPMDRSFLSRQFQHHGLIISTLYLGE